MLVLIGAALAAVIPAQAKVSPEMIANLNTAFQGESNAANRYAAFARKAEAEGYGYAARLFRAAAQAEAIHKERHKTAIVALGGQVKSFQLDEVKIGSTAQNLQASINGESYERDTMYPSFLKRAQAENSKIAIRAVLYAQKAETEHAKLFQEALTTLDQKIDRPVYVCKVCGYTTNALPDRSCPSCRESTREFMRID